MVEVEIGGEHATIASHEWVSGDELLLSILRQDLAIRDNGDYDPFPALTIATEAVNRYGGRIIRQEPPDYDPKLIY